MTEIPVTPPAEQPHRNRGLWYLVIGLGVAILVVVAAMIAMAVRNAWKKPDAPTLAVTAVPGDVPQLALDLPPGSTVGETHMEGATLLVRVTSAAGDEILIIDPREAKLIARVKLNKPASGTAPP